MGIDLNDLPESYRAYVKAQEQKRKKTKYGNTPTARGNHKFDSQKEANRWDELLVLYAAGAIKNLRRQQEFRLMGSFVDMEGNRARGISYIADFFYEEKHTDRYGTEVWVRVVEDVKSEATAKDQKYAIKKKLMKEVFGITIREV